MTLFELFDTLETSAAGQFVRDSLWLFPAIEAVHLLGLSLLGGTVLVVDLRLLGVGLTERSAPAIWAATRWWFCGALLLMFATGIPLFLSEAVKCYFNPSFWVKMIALGVAILFTLTIRRQVLRRARSRVTLLLTGIVSIVLWFTVAAAGRWIGFS
jgi:hypothetical protein